MAFDMSDRMLAVTDHAAESLAARPGPGDEAPMGLKEALEDVQRTSDAMLALSQDYAGLLEQLVGSDFVAEMKRLSASVIKR